MMISLQGFKVLNISHFWTWDFGRFGNLVASLAFSLFGWVLTLAAFPVCVLLISSNSVETRPQGLLDFSKVEGGLTTKMNEKHLAP